MKKRHFFQVRLTTLGVNFNCQNRGRGEGGCFSGYFIKISSVNTRKMCIDFQYKFESGKNILFSREYLYWFSIQKNDHLKSIAKSIEIVILI